MPNSILAIPRHVGIIMDGNGRWAEKRGKKRSYGHEAGANVIEQVADTLFSHGVQAISLYAFSTENFSRPKEEVDYLMKLLGRGIKRYADYSKSKNVRFMVSGDISALDKKLRSEIIKQTAISSNEDAPVLNILLNYGGRSELCRAFNLMVKDEVKVADEKTLEQYLYTATLPPLDLIIRTGGEKRLSNFLLWQAAYAELYFTDILWPDFSKEEAEKALEWFSHRSRRFGNV